MHAGWRAKTGVQLKKLLKGNLTEKRMKGSSNSKADADVIQPMDVAMARRLKLFPETNRGVRTRLSFRQQGDREDKPWLGWKRLQASEAIWLELTPGATIYQQIEVYAGSDNESFGCYVLYASGEEGAALLNIEDGAEVDVIGKWVYAVGIDCRSTYESDKEDRTYDEYKGFVVAEIVSG